MWFLSIRPVRESLPRLTHLFYSEIILPEDDFADFLLTSFSGPNLTSLDFTPTYNEKEQDWPLLSSLIDELPHLKAIGLKGESRSTGHAFHNIISQSTLLPPMNTSFTRGRSLPCVCSVT